MTWDGPVTNYHNNGICIETYIQSILLSHWSVFHLRSGIEDKNLDESIESISSRMESEKKDQTQN